MPMTMAFMSAKTGVSPSASRNKHDSCVQCGEPAKGKKLRAGGVRMRDSRSTLLSATHKTMIGRPSCIVACSDCVRAE